MNFAKIALQKIDEENLAPPERPENKHKDGALGCTLSLDSLTRLD